jgi:hypothetical protein
VLSYSVASREAPYLAGVANPNPACSLSANRRRIPAAACRNIRDIGRYICKDGPEHNHTAWRLDCSWTLFSASDVLRLSFLPPPIFRCSPRPRATMDDVSAEGPRLSLRLGVVTIFLAYVIYAYIQRRKEYEAC